MTYVYIIYCIYYIHFLYIYCIVYIIQYISYITYFLERNLTLEEFYRKIRITHFDAISRVKKEDIIRAYSLLEVTNDSINTDKR